MAEFVGNIREKGLTAALDQRDGQHGDYRTTGREVEASAPAPAADTPAGGINYAS
jgi:hypothetical protein